MNKKLIGIAFLGIAFIYLIISSIYLSTHYIPKHNTIVPCYDNNGREIIGLHCIKHPTALDDGRVWFNAIITFLLLCFGYVYIRPDREEGFA